jgi:hypothetical protein
MYGGRGDGGIGDDGKEEVEKFEDVGRGGIDSSSYFDSPERCTDFDPRPGKRTIFGDEELRWEIILQ